MAARGIAGAKTREAVNPGFLRRMPTAKSRGDQPGPTGFRPQLSGCVEAPARPACFGQADIASVLPGLKLALWCRRRRGRMSANVNFPNHCNGIDGYPLRSGGRTLLCNSLPRARTIVLMQDNLHIHGKASLYEAFPAVEARRMVGRFERHYTPNHGSWQDLAESELGILSTQCLDRRIPDSRRNCRLATRAQRQLHQGRLALHYRGCSH